MKPLLASLFLAIALTGCASTTGTKVYHNGQKILETSADADEMTVTPNGTFSAKKLNHSRPIMARSKGIERILKGGGAAVGQGGRAFLGP